jgi:hypothetical protein
MRKKARGKREQMAVGRGGDSGRVARVTCEGEGAADMISAERNRG